MSSGPVPPATGEFLRKARTFLELVKFEHTAFALPFAYMGMILARRTWPGWATFFWVTAAMVGARTAGMALNRLIDARIDAMNPRTSSRPSVTGAFPEAWTRWAVAGALALLLVSAAALNPLCLKLSPLALVLLTGYHYVKRFSFLCHFALGLVLALAPLGGWFGVTGRLEWQPFILSAAVLSWVAGFDIFYSLQDADFDRTHGLHSVPVRFGAARALRISAACHVATVLFLAVFAPVAGLGILYGAGVAVTGALLWTEHRLISGGNLSRINAAFFTVNGWVGIILLIFTFLDIFR